jgi:predicted transcriptional regulator of viral defense system
MKSLGPELGNLSSRFFAYVQLKNKDTVRTGELIPVLGITASKERNLLSRLSNTGWIVRLKRGLYLIPPRIPAGGKYSPGIAMILQKLMGEEDGKYQICGPTAFNFYGFDDQVPSVTYVYNNCISDSRTIGNLAFQFIKVKDERLGATNAVNTRGVEEVIYSSKARTLMDALVDVVIRYGNQATTRRIGCLLDVLGQPSRLVNRLQRQINNSRAIIPWIPDRPARGKASRKWGIVLNE